MTRNSCDDKKVVLLIGASVRALAFAAIEAGWRPYCADLFADRDLQAWAPVIRLPSSEYPYGFLRWLRESAPPGPVLYTGRLERYERVLFQLQQLRPLWGNSAAVARAVRDPCQLARAVSRAGLHFAEWRREAHGLPQDGSWIVRYKNRVARWRGTAPARAVNYWQRFIAGEPASAVFIGNGQNCLWLGATKQLIGCSWLHAHEFQWCGNIGPLACSKKLSQRLRQLGQALTQEFKLRGVFGVDFILQDDVPWVVEINPRYPASLEVLELATGCQWFWAHVSAFAPTCSANMLEALSYRQLNKSRCHVFGKAILYAPKSFTFRFADIASAGYILSPGTVPSEVAFADVPEEHTLVRCGAPILTVLVRGGSLYDTWRRLQTVAAQVYDSLKISSQP